MLFDFNIFLLISNSLLVSSFQLSSPRSYPIHRHSATIAVESAIAVTGEKDENQNIGNNHFDWFKSWYPLVPVEILDRDKPHRFHLLGQDIVVWNDSPIEGSAEFRSKSKRPRGATRSDTGSWRVFEDECPHRKVPLSEGRIEDDGTLLCSYHAWRFDGQGSCVAIPQVESENELMRIKSNPKSNCNSYPTKVINGILFVWPSSDKDAVLESELTPVVHRPAETDVKRLWEGPWNFRELPYGADFFIENVVDPAHVSVSHHNIVGSRYESQEMRLSSVKPLSKNGFSISTRLPGSSHPSFTHFESPSLVAIDVEFGDGGARQTLELYISPSRPGFSYHCGRIVILKDQKGETPKLLSGFTTPIPKWLNHVLASAFLNQDGLFLHHQERYMASTNKYTSVLKEGEEPYHYTKAISPSSSDMGVIMFRNWIRKLAGGRIPYKNNPTMPPSNNDIVFDVYNGHTKYCKYCQDALRRLKKVRMASFIAASVVGILRPPQLSAVGSLLVSTLFGGMGLILNKLIGMFYRYEFSHAHND